jgi:acyl-CoA dehydrogenase family protein 9
MAERAEAQPSFMRALCMGDIEEGLIHPYPELPDANKEVLRDVLGSVDTLLSSHANDFRHWDAKGEFPESFIDELKEFGLFGLVIPEEQGGLGFGSAAYSRTLQQVARYDASVAVTIGAHSSIGMRGLLLFGNAQQREKYYPDLATGKRVAAFCLTEPGSGSDASSIRTTAEQQGDHWVLNGEKLWITNGGIASFFTVFARTTTSDGKGRMTAFLVTPEMGGVTAGPHEDKMGIRASSTTTITFDNTRVPNDHVLGDIGAGFKVAMAILNNGRTGLGGGSVGAMKNVIALAAQHARDRKQFGKSISEFGLVKQKLGRMMVDCYAAESVVNLVAHMIDSKSQDYAVEAAVSKVFASEALFRVSDEALQIAAGIGYMRELPYERVARDARIMRIFEGTNEILRLFIALTAMSDVSSQLQELSSGLKGVFNDPIKGFGVLSGYALKQAGLRGITQTRKLGSIPEPLRDVAAIFEEATRELAQGADRILRKHGRAIIDKQLATRRLADIMIDLFVLAAMLSRVSTNMAKHGAQAVEREAAILRSFAGQAKTRIDRNFARIDDNEDELIKTLGDFAVEREGYPWDVI